MAPIRFHRAEIGIKVNFEGDIFTDTGVGDDCVEKYLGVIHDVPQLFPAGEQFSYNNAGFCVLGRLVEVLRGKTYDDCLREHLFAPLGLTHAAAGPYEAIMFRDYFKRPTHQVRRVTVASPSLVPRSTQSIRQQRGWTAKGDGWVGPYATRRGTWQGKGVQRRPIGTGDKAVKRFLGNGMVGKKNWWPLWPFDGGA